MRRYPHAVPAPEPRDNEGLGGRASQVSQSRQVYLFGRVAASATPADFEPEGPIVPAWSAQPAGHQICERLWRVRTAGQCLQRFGEGLSPLEPNSFNNPAQVNASEGGSGFFKLRVRADTSSGHLVLNMDVGQTLDLYCYKLDADLVGPTNAFEAVPQNRALATSQRTGLVVDARIGCSLLAVEESVSNVEAKYTTHLSVLDNATGVIEVPKSAVSVRIIADAGGANPGNWTRFVGDPRLFPAYPTGEMVFVDRALIEDHWTIGDETHIQTDQQAGVDRFFTFIWTIRP